MKNKLLFSLLFLLAACSYTEKIRDGKTAFERKQFATAIPMLEKEFKKADTKKEKSTLALQLGESYQKIGKNADAIAWFQKSVDNGNSIDAVRALAFAYKQDEQYSEALKTFKALGVEIGSPFEYKKDIEMCQNALKWKTARSPYIIEKQSFNSASDDYAPCIYSAEQLVITSDRNNNKEEKKYKWTGKSFSDLYVVDKNNGQIKPFGNQINTAANEGTATFNADFNFMVFAKNAAINNNDDQFTKLFSSEREGALWSEPKPLSFCKENINYWHPALSSDAKTLIFSANDDNGFGGFDLFITHKKEGSDWSEPKLLPRNINSVGNEVFPTLDADTLCFSSDFHAGMGGLDIFKTYKIAENAWAQPQNLRAPINSGADDFSFIIDKNATKEKDVLQRGFFSSNRKGGQGGDDIYALKKVILPPLPIDTTKKTTTETNKNIFYKFILEGYILEKIFSQPDNPNSKVLGRKGIANSVVSIVFGKENKKISTNEEGFFSLEIAEETDYQIFANKSNYLNGSTTFSSKGYAKDPNNPIQKFEIELILDKIYKNQEIVLENIYYDYDKWDIRADAQPTLDKLARTLIENPNIKIQLNSHTDCRGNDNYNLELSQRRAQAAVDYLISKGVASERLNAKGYGESVPVTTCQCNKCSEQEHQINRRTTFKIVE